MRSRAWRIAQEEIKKIKVKSVVKSRFLNENREPTLEEIGKAASVHCCKCSCWMCGNPRKHFKQRTLKEQALEPIEVILRDFI